MSKAIILGDTEKQKRDLQTVVKCTVPGLDPFWCRAEDMVQVPIPITAEIPHPKDPMQNVLITGIGSKIVVKRAVFENEKSVVNLNVYGSFAFYPDCPAWFK